MMQFSEKDIRRLFTFPEQNPNPVIEIDAEGNITYQNPASKVHFPDLARKGKEHTVFSEALLYIKNSGGNKAGEQVREINFNQKIYEQKLYFLEDGAIRIYCNDITERKKIEQELLTLALFPKQNPNPVLEACFKTGIITYTNPAAEARFPDLKEKGTAHLLLGEVSRRIREGKDFQCELVTGKTHFEQKIFFIPETEKVRVYSTDVTHYRDIERKLKRLASFPEQNPNPVLEIDLEQHITYYNPATPLCFPDFPDLLFNHPMFDFLKTSFEEIKNGKLIFLNETLKIEEKFFDMRARFMQDTGLVRVFYNDITAMKKAEETIREKNKDITDSINYAKRIQTSILPEPGLLLQHFPGSFVYYRPKDIVSGDFYWYVKEEDYFLIACADCTGHGVPGALMSMIGSNALTDVVQDKYLDKPGQALNGLDKRIRKLLKQETEGVDSRDGMDIALCSIHTEKKILHYSGANRPIAIIRKGEIIECDPSKYPIGGTSSAQKLFEENEIQLQEGDRIFLFTDGITDQFGGPKGKKWMKKNVLQLLLDTSDKNMQDQCSALETAFEDWKGELEQVDDVCVIGIEI